MASSAPRRLRLRPTSCSSSTGPSSPRSRTEAAQIRDDARADAESIRTEILAKAREESDRIIAAGRDSLAVERQTIVRELRAEVGGLAVDLASRIVGESLADEARRKGTVERFLTDLESAGAR